MFIVDVNKNKLKHLFINILSYVSGTESVVSFNILQNKNFNLLNTLYKNPWAEQCFSITIFRLKYKNFFFVLPISNTTENSKIKHVVFRRLCCLLLFRIRNIIFTYVFFASKYEKSAELWSKFPENLPSKDVFFFRVQFR